MFSDCYWINGGTSEAGNCFRAGLTHGYFIIVMPVLDGMFRECGIGVAYAGRDCRFELMMELSSISLSLTSLNS